MSRRHVPNLTANTLLMPDDLLQVIAAGGDAPPELSHDDLRKIFEGMVLLRTFDERAVALQRQGRIGTYPLFWGEEATQAGPLYALSDEDWVFPSYRQGVIAILRGLNASVPLMYRRGYGGRHGFWNPRRFRVAPSIVPIATQLPHAVGLSWAAKLRGDAVACLVFFGDGATSEGDFHEAMNFAAVLKTPTVFFCVNNQWAISTPFARQTATATVAEKAVGYGMPSVRVDGFDPIACWKGARDALERARSGGGPTLVEAVCYRLRAHATADDPGRYRDPAEAARWESLEPVGRTGTWLKERGVLDDAGEHAIREAARVVIDEAVAELEAARPPDRAVLFDYVYASRPPTWEPDAAE